MCRWIRSATGLLAVCLVLPVAGCGEQPPNPPTAVVVQTTVAAPTEPGQIELSDPLVTFQEPDRVQFEVRYRFTQGQPSKHYLCEISFPGTANLGAKTMASWELKPAGVIKDAVVVAEKPASFEIRFSEADSPQNGYKLISNVASGPVKQDNAK